MENNHYTRAGFKGLNLKGKLMFLLVLAGIGGLIWLLSVRGDVEAAKQSGENVLISYLIGGLKIITGGLIGAYGVHFFLGRKKIERQGFYCCDCGEFIGYRIESCPNPECGSNRYTTDAGKARRAKRKFNKEI